MKLTIQRLFSKYALQLIVAAVLLFAFTMLDDLDKRMLGQFLTIASYMVIALLSYAKLSCPARRFQKALRHAFRENDFRMLRAILRNRNLRLRVFCCLGSTCCVLGAIAQVYSNQVAEKPIFFHLGAPFICAVLFWALVHPQRSSYGTTRKD